MLKLLLCDSDSDFLQCLKKMILEVVQENILISLYKNPETLLVIYALSDFLIMILSWLVKQSLRAFLFQEVQL